MKVAVYPGSFDPLHIGHLAIMEYLTGTGEFDWVYLVVSPQNPLKDRHKLENSLHRYQDAIEAVKRHPELHVRVDDIEMNMTPPHYTVRTLDALKQREPDNDFTLVIGADNLQDIHRWRDFPRILSEYGVAVYPRKGFDLGAIRAQLHRECIHRPAPYVMDPYSSRALDGTVGFEDLEGIYNIEIIDAPIVDISSTRIREALARGEDVSQYLM